MVYQRLDHAVWHRQCFSGAQGKLRLLRAGDEQINRSLAPPGGAPATTPAGLDPFSLGDPAVTTRILGAAGFTDVRFADVHEPVHYGDDVDAALDWIRGFICTGQALARLGPDDARRALERLRAELAARLTGDGVWFDSRAWLVSARSPGEHGGRALPG